MIASQADHGRGPRIASRLGGNDNSASNRHIFELPHLDRPPAFSI
jgi:hypothetical protein